MRNVGSLWGRAISRSRRTPLRVSALRCALALAAILLLLAGNHGQALAQRRLVEKVSRAEVPVFEDNLADAKDRVVRRAQSTALRSLISDLVADEWIVLYDKELRRIILPHRSRYVNSYRARKLEASVDRTKYLALLSVRLDRERLMDDLRELGLPILSDTVSPVVLLYGRDDPAMRAPGLRDPVVEQLSKRLALLNFKLTGSAELPANQAGVLASPTSEVKDRLDVLRRINAGHALFVAFEPLAGAGKGARVRGWLYRRDSGMVLATFEHQNANIVLSARSASARKGVMSALVEPWLLRLTPGAIQEAQFTAEGASKLRVRVSGFASVEDQERFEQAFFDRKSPFNRFLLYGYTPRAVLYEGSFGGDRRRLERSLSGKEMGDFKVRQVDWYNGVLELNVERILVPDHPEPRLFPPETRPPDVAASLESFFANYTGLEVEDPTFAETEDNGWLTRANRLPLDATVYGYIDARSDKDVFIAEALPDDATFTIVWVRVGRSNLSPTLRIYDEEGVLVTTFQPTTWLRYRYTLPKGQHRFYLEIADRFGYLKVDTGGYRTFHYVFKVSQDNKEG